MSNCKKVPNRESLMPLVEMRVCVGAADLPDEVCRFLAEAERRIEAFEQDARVAGFVPSDYAGAYRWLHAVADAQLAPGRLFCEWGSGFGVVACLAAMLGFDACGIEIEAELVDQARRLADDFALPVPFYYGSYVPRAEARQHKAGGGFAFLATAAASEKLDLDADDFDIIFAYPAPDDVGFTQRLFERHARIGALLLTHHYGGRCQVQRKSPPSRR